MRSRAPLFRVNLLLVAVFVGILLGCGSDPTDPPKGSLEEKLCGEWESDPLPLDEKEKDVERKFFAIEMSCWDYHMRVICEEKVVLKSGAKPTQRGFYDIISKFKYAGLIATSDAPRSHSTGVIRLDPNDSNLIYVTWILNDGTKRLDEVKFHCKSHDY